MPEAPSHHNSTQQLTLVLEAWARRQNRPIRVARNLAVRWLEDHPTTGIDPDVCVLAPPPPNFDDIGSLCLWKPGNLPPPISFEIVSRNHPYKDYCDVQDRYAAFGAYELVVFDPLLAGPRSLGGPVLLQLWRQDSGGGLERVHFGSTPAYSETLDAWLIPDGRFLRFSNDRRGTQRWLTEAEYAQADAERAQADAERAQANAERAQADAERERIRREDVERRLEELERKLGG